MHRLQKTIPAPRLSPYARACAGSGTTAIELYRWANAVALAMFDDLSVVEVAMRSAMARELTRSYGPRWFQRSDLFDDGSLREIDEALRRNHLMDSGQPDDVVNGKLVAGLMFGFWVRLLGRGAFHGSGPARERRIYDSALWKPSLHRAFPHIAPSGRASVESAARRLQALRNRIAHHEHVVFGVPLPGVRDPDGSPVRLSAAECHSTLVTLAHRIDADLGGWIDDYSRVPSLLADCPVERSKLVKGP